MAFVKVGTENSTDIELYYEDHGTGQPVVLIHGFPLEGRAWERQSAMLLESGFRVITYDRRGFGQSSQPTIGYGYDTFAADLDALMTALDLDNAVLVGFSMGTGEVTRYLGKYGSARVNRAVLIGAIPPFLLQTDDNADGVPQSVFDGIKDAVIADRYAFFPQFFADFYNTDEYLDNRVSQQVLDANFITAAGASAYATLAVVDTWLTDFRTDVAKIDVPTLVLHGTEDRILPFENTSARLEALNTNISVTPIEGGPHNIPWTHFQEVNEALRNFITK